MRRQTFLITGATGNVGIVTIRGLQEIMTSNKIVAAVRNPFRALDFLSKTGDIEIRKLDFEDHSTFRSALDDIDIVFLLRPPQLADVPKIFDPFIREMKSLGIYKIIFLTVQGVENQKMIPHHKLEQLIQHHKLDHIFYDRDILCKISLRRY